MAAPQEVRVTGDWCANDRLWVDIQTAIFPAEREAAAVEETAQMCILADVEPGTRVLDLCCGPGRHAVEFAKRGCAVTGVDLTQPYLEHARQRAKAAGVQIELVHEDMRRFVRPEAFDLITNLYSSFSYFEDPEDDLLAIKNIWRSLAPGGLLVMDLMGKEVVAAMFQQRNWQQLPDGTLWLEERAILDGWRRIRNRWTIIRDGRSVQHVLEHTLFSGQELQQLLERGGFEEVALCGEFDGSQYDETSERLVAVARKQS